MYLCEHEGGWFSQLAIGRWSHSPGCVKQHTLTKLSLDTLHLSEQESEAISNRSPLFPIPCLCTSLTSQLGSAGLSDVCFSEINHHNTIFTIGCLSWCGQMSSIYLILGSVRDPWHHFHESILSCDMVSGAITYSQLQGPLNKAPVLGYLENRSNDKKGNMISSLPLQLLRSSSVADFMCVRESSPTPLVWISTIVCHIQHRLLIVSHPHS